MTPAGLGTPAAGAFPLESQDAVQDVEGGSEGPADPDEKLREHLPVDARAHVPFRFPVADDAAEEVFHGEGEEHLAVRLELGEVYDRVRPEGLLGDLDRSERLADLHADGILKRPAFDIQTAEGVADAAHPEDRIKGADRGAVGDERSRPPFEDVLHGGADEGGVGEDGVLRLCRRQQVRLDQDTASPPDCLSPHSLHQFEDPRLKRAVVVGCMSDHHAGHRPFALM